MRVDPEAGGVASARLVNSPPSIVVGDVLRDSAGAPTLLQAEAFDEAGRLVATAPLRFVYVPATRDAQQRLVLDSALTVDSVRGAVTARNEFRVPQALVAVQVGGRLQIVDTLQIVPRPDSALVDSAAALALRFSCTDTTRVLVQRPDTAQVQRIDTLYAYNAVGPFRVRVRGDSLGTRVNVRQRLVRWRVEAPFRIPAARLPGGTARDTVPAISVAPSDGDRAGSLDTTDNTTGLSGVRLRIRPTALTRGVVASDTFSVVVRADVQPGPVPIAGPPLALRVQLARDPRAACP